MELQIALDRIPLHRAVELTQALNRTTDWIEVGTSLIKQYGLTAVEQVVSAANGTPVLADTKTADDAFAELSMFYAAGAKSATVLGVTDPTSISKAIDVAAEHGAEIVIDLLGVDDVRSAALTDMAQGKRHVVVGLHAGKDTQQNGKRQFAVEAWPASVRLAVAGGLTLHDLPHLRAARPDVRVIIGAAITSASDAVAVASELYSAIHRHSEGRGQ